MKHFLFLITCFFTMTAFSKSEFPNEILLTDNNYSYSVKIEKKTGRIRLTTIKGLGGIPDSSALVFSFGSQRKAEVQLRLVSAYEDKNLPQFEGTLWPTKQPIIGVEFSFLSGGTKHSLKWKNEQSR